MSVSPLPLSPPTDRDQQGSRGYQYRWMVMAVVIVADVMDLLDATIANLAGPSIRADLGGSAEHPAVGARGVHHGLRGRPGHLRPGRRPGRPAPDVHHRHGRLHPRLPALRAGADRRRADRLPGPAGRLRRGDDPAGAGHGEAVLPPRRPAEGLHPVRPDHGAGRRARPDPGRLPPRRRPVRHRLADDLPDQRPGRRRRHRPRDPLPAGPAPQPRGEAGRRRLGPARRSPPRC